MPSEADRYREATIILERIIARLRRNGRDEEFIKNWVVGQRRNGQEPNALGIGVLTDDQVIDIVSRSFAGQGYRDTTSRERAEQAQQERERRRAEEARQRAEEERRRAEEARRAAEEAARATQEEMRRAAEEEARQREEARRRAEDTARAADEAERRFRERHAQRAAAAGEAGAAPGGGAGAAGGGRAAPGGGVPGGPGRRAAGAGQAQGAQGRGRRRAAPGGGGGAGGRRQAAPNPSPENENVKITVDSYPMRDVEIDIYKLEKIKVAAIIRYLIEGDFIDEDDLDRDAAGGPRIPNGDEDNGAIDLPQNNLILRDIYALMITQPADPEELKQKLLLLFEAYYEQRYAGKFTGRKANTVVNLIVDQIIFGARPGGVLKPAAVDPDFYKGSTRLRQRGYFGYSMATMRYPEFKDFITPFEDIFRKGPYEFKAPEKMTVGNENTRTPAQSPAAGKEFTFFKWEVIRPALKYNVRNLRDTTGNIRPVIRMEGDKYVEEWPVGYNKIRVDIDEEGIMLIAHYHAVDKHEKYGPMLYGSPYRSGRMPGAYGAKDSAIAAAGKAFRRGEFKSEGYKGPSKYDEGRSKTFSMNPVLNAATNKGKRLLNQYIRAEYSRIYTPLQREFKDRRDRLRLLASEAKKARGAMRKELRTAGVGWARVLQAGLGRKADQDLMNIAQNIQAQTTQPTNMPAILDAYRAIEEYDREYRDFEEGFSKKMEAASSDLRQLAVDRAVNITVMVSRRFKVPLNSPDQVAIGAELKDYASDLAERFATRGRTALFALTRGLEGIGRGLQTAGAAWTNIFHNLWGLIFGTWTIHTIFVLIQFFFMLSYVGYDPRLLWIMPLIAAVFTFLINFENAPTPLDWVALLATGAMMGYSAILLMTIVGAFFWFDGSISIWFWVIWAALALFMGNFQIFQTGGYKSVLHASVVILLFAYVALGPYSGYYQQAVDQVKPAAETAYHIVKNAASDVYLLATNPTAWYSRQQQLNTIPEKPIDIARGIEVVALDSLPQSVPAGLNFAIVAVIKNDGELEKAEHVSVSFDCNAYCDETAARISPRTTPPISYYDSLTASQRSAFDNDQEFYLKPAMRKGDSDIFNIEPFIAKTLANRVAETQFAKVNMTVSYVYESQSSLLVTVIDKPTLEQRFRQGEDVFRQVAARAKVTPAKLSLNVGPQPLIYDNQQAAGAAAAAEVPEAATDINKYLLLVSISAARDDSNIVLTRNTNIIIKIPRTLAVHTPGTNEIDCGQTATVDDTTDLENYIVTYNVQPAEDFVEIKSYNTNSIFSFLCKFKLADMAGTKSSLVTAKIDDYFVKTIKEKQIIVTTPIGIIYDPFEQECNKCGQGASNLCGEAECLGLSKGNNKCWYEGTEAGATAAVKRIASDVCNSCGPVVSCEKFLRDDICIASSLQCGWSCNWDPNAVHPKTGQRTGACVSAVAPPPAPGAGGIISATGASCTQLGLCAAVTPATFVSYAPKTLIESTGVAPGDTEFYTAVGAVMYRESGCAHYFTATDVKCSAAKAVGVMQVLPATAATYRISAARLCEPDGSAGAGASYLYHLRNTFWAASANADDNWKFAFAAYIAGQGYVDNAIGRVRTAGLAVTWDNVKPRLTASDGNTRTSTYAEQVFTRFRNPTQAENCYHRS